MSRAFDLLVIGGGPAGSALAALAAGAGVRTLVLERDEAPPVEEGQPIFTM